MVGVVAFFTIIYHKFATTSLHLHGFNINWQQNPVSAWYTTTAAVAARGEPYNVRTLSTTIAILP